VTDKKCILAEADACQTRVELGALLRQEGLCGSQLQTWRRHLAAQDEAGLTNAEASRKPLKDAKTHQISTLPWEMLMAEQNCA
jgi:hypothetical protein